MVSSTPSEASIDIPGLGSAKWRPHIADGLGEVYSQGAGGREESVYTSIVVSSRIVTFDGASLEIAHRLENEAPRKKVQLACSKRKEGEYLVIAFGDSLTAGADSSYPEELQRQSIRNGVRVVNAGVPGDTTEKLLARADSILACNPNAVLLAVGANDIFQGIHQGDFETALKLLILKLRLGGTNVILLGLEVEEKFPYAGSYVRVATTMRVPLIPNMLRGVYKIPAMLLEDGMHPNRKGNVLIASQVAQFLALCLDSSLILCSD